MKCPTCGKEAEWKDNPYRPFCSERCKLVDLGRWVDEEYRVPGETIPKDQKDKTVDEEHH
jgi:endogenous inhibitor of DNA gyrase (YacG/DUF329 family)